jgi:hypothetical protein
VGLASALGLNKTLGMLENLQIVLIYLSIEYAIAKRKVRLRRILEQGV